MFYKCAWERERKKKSLNLFGKCSREKSCEHVIQREKAAGQWSKAGLCLPNSGWKTPPSRAAFVADFVFPAFNWFFLKVNRGLTQWDGDTCSFPTTGNKFACQACASQIKHALFGMIYEHNVVPGAFGCEGLRVCDGGEGVAGGAAVRRVSDLSYRKTDL